LMRLTIARLHSLTRLTIQLYEADYRT
jgi:hypothetical protein